MNYITAEKFQDLCNTQISVPEFFPFESKSSRADSAYTFDKFDNWDLVYVNNDLVKSPVKQNHIETGAVDLYPILEKMKNPFSLVLHSNDSPFEEEDLRYFSISNCKKIYAQNVQTTHPNLIPLPIGLGNSCWPYGDLSAFEGIEVTENKTKEIYFNFTVEGGCRDVKRPDCFKRCTELEIPWIENKNQKEYLKDLSQYKFIVSPEGNGIDCHRTWEALYLKVIPIVDKNITTEYFSKFFPMVLVEDWSNFKLKDVLEIYEFADWSNYYLLDFDLFTKKFFL